MSQAKAKEEKCILHPVIIYFQVSSTFSNPFRLLTIFSPHRHSLRFVLHCTWTMGGGRGESSLIARMPRKKGNGHRAPDANKQQAKNGNNSKQKFGAIGNHRRQGDRRGTKKTTEIFPMPNRRGARNNGSQFFFTNNKHQQLYNQIGNSPLQAPMALSRRIIWNSKKNGVEPRSCSPSKWACPSFLPVAHTISPDCLVGPSLQS